MLVNRIFVIVKSTRSTSRQVDKSKSRQVEKSVLIKCINGSVGSVQTEKQRRSA